MTHWVIVWWELILFLCNNNPMGVTVVFFAIAFATCLVLETDPRQVTFDVNGIRHL